MAELPSAWQGIRLQGKLTTLFDAATHELRIPGGLCLVNILRSHEFSEASAVLLRVDAVGVHTLRLLILAEATSS